MPGNALQGGCAFRGRHDDFWYFDQLPPTARNALANAVFDWSSGWVHGAWRRGRPGFKTGADVAARIAEADARQIEKDRNASGGMPKIFLAGDLAGRPGRVSQREKAAAPKRCRRVRGRQTKDSMDVV
jgi:hypothetical protein